MKTSLKIFTLTILFLLLFITNINASGILMNLEDYNQNTTNTQPNTNIVNQYSNNNELGNDISNEQTSIADIDNDNPRITSTVTSNDDEFLTVENILSIITIVIGILLIFLAIAILVRFK